MSEGTIHRRFESWALATPDALAFRHAGRSYSYADLAARAQAITAKLETAGRVHGEVFVVLLAGDPVGELAAILGILSGGGIAVPVEAHQPPYRVRQIVDHCTPQAILASEIEEARRLIPERVAISTAGGGAQPTTRVDVSPDAPAYVCYTSGSTGEPKGVCITHRQVLARIEGFATALGLLPTDRHTQLNSLGTGSGLSSVWRGLLTGGALLTARVREQGIAELLEWLNKEEATVFACSATLFRTFAARLKPSDCLESVRILRLGSERVTPGDFALFKQHCRRDAVFVNSYSCSESSSVTLHLLTHAAEVDGDSVPIGRPLPGCAVRLIGEDGIDVPQGDIGEIVVEGPFVASGYWRDPERSASVFESLDADSSARRLRTGDLARMLPDGVLVHLGRRDFRVKIRGFRVEIEGIETVLSRAPDVRQAAVFVNDSGRDDATLVALVVPDAGKVEEGALRAFAAAHLPIGSVPHRFVFVEALPLAHSGKLDRRQLPGVAAAVLTSESAPVEPDGSVVEQQVATIWSEVLGHRRFGNQDDFLFAGGDSLRAMRVLTRIQDRFGVDIPLRDFLNTPTVASLAAKVETKSREELLLAEAELETLLDEIDASHSDSGGGSG